MLFRVLCTISLFVSVAANAQTCSGGTDGGMDATGNQCNEPATSINTESAASGKTPNAAASAGIAALAPTRTTATRANPQLTRVVHQGESLLFQRSLNHLVSTQQP
jgi:hypothetical protein